MRIIVRPVIDPQREIDLTHRLVSTIAEELWRHFGGNDEVNWLEAERLLKRMVCKHRGEIAESAAFDVFAGSAGAGERSMDRREQVMEEVFDESPDRSKGGREQLLGGLDAHNRSQASRLGHPTGRNESQAPMPTRRKIEYAHA